MHFLIILLAGALVTALLATLEMTARTGGEKHSDVRLFPFQFHNISSTRIASTVPFLVADIDRDGNDDFLISESTRLLWYRFRGTEMVLAGEAAYERPGITGMVADVNGDARPEFFVLTESSKGWMLSCHDWFSPKGPSAPLYTTGPLLPLGGSGTMSWRRIMFLGSFTVEKGAHPSIYIGLNPNKAEGVARSLLAYDGTTGRDLWRFDLGPQTQELTCGNFGVNDPRLLLATFAVGSGISYGGTSDSVSSLFCLDLRDGRLLWKMDLTGCKGRSNVAIADINGDGQNEILVARHLSRIDPRQVDNPRSWTVAALNREGEMIQAAPMGRSATSVCAVDLDSGPFLKVLVQGLDERFFILNHDFTIDRIAKAIQEASYNRPLIFGVLDMEGDGRREILCRASDMLVVRNQRGTLIAGRWFKALVSPQIVRYEGRDYVANVSGDSLFVMTLKRTPLAMRIQAYARRFAIEMLTAALVAGVGGFHFRRYLKRRREKGITFDEAHNDLLTAMSAFGHGGSSLKVIDRIRLHLKNWDRVQSDATARGELFARLRTTFVETVVPELNHIVMLAHKARVPEEIWRPITPRAGLAGQAMEAIVAIGSGEPAGDREEHIASALKALDDVDESIAGVRSYLRSVFRVPAVEAIERAIARFRDEHEGAGVSLVLPSDAPAIAGVFMSPVAFDKILESLLSNSARATGGKADAAIAIEVRWEGNYCTIDIRDNGCGIPREDWERAFERYFTTKAEGGFGLYYAREMLAKFGGKIFVLDSVVGSGTTMRTVLRKS